MATKAPAREELRHCFRVTLGVAEGEKEKCAGQRNDKEADFEAEEHDAACDSR